MKPSAILDTGHKTLIVLTFSCLAAGLLYWPQAASGAVREGLDICGNVIFPALFPFLVLSSLAVELGLTEYLGKLLWPMMRSVFHLSGACSGALALGIAGGCPVGARTAGELYKKGQCSREEAERLLAFCNNAGPGFILGIMGTGIFGSGRAGALLWLSHVGAAALVGVLLRPGLPAENGAAARRKVQIRSVPFSSALTKSVTGALRAMLNICAFVLFFRALLAILEVSGVLSQTSGFLKGMLGISEEKLRPVLSGFLEMSAGAAELEGAGRAMLPAAALLLGWGGLSVHCQTAAILSGSGLSLKYYLAGKLLQGLLASLLTALALRLLPGEFTAFAPDAGVAGCCVDMALARYCVCAWALWLIFLGIGLVILKISSRNSRGRGV